MPFCPSCGAPVEGAFCGKCGTSVAAGGPAPSQPGYQAPVASSGLSSNAASALCYVPFFIGLIASILFLVLAPFNQDRTVRFHAFQSIFLHVAGIVIWIGLSIVSVVLSAVSLTLATTFGLLTMLVWIGFLVLWVLLIVKAYQGSKIVLPVIGPLAQKQA